ncbi:MAG: hypothetical protein IKP46_07255 [Bacteroidales bacterium]|nr:hypothetical protein [Bacteroidales bacterium]
MSIFILYSLFALRDDNDPARKLHRRVGGYYSTLEQAIEAMPEERRSNERPGDPIFLYCFIVEEFPVDVQNHGNLREWLFSPDGKQLDYRLADSEFHGRMDDEIRFKVGDIVDVICSKGGKLIAEPMIVGRTPFTPELLKKYADELAEYGQTPDPEEEYNCLPLNGKAYEYVSPARVMPLQRPLGAETEKAFKDYLANARNNKIYLRRRW